MAQNPKITPDQAAKLAGMRPGEVVILDGGLKRRAVVYHLGSLEGDFRVRQCGEQVRIERLGWLFRSNRGKKGAVLIHKPDTRQKPAYEEAPKRGHVDYDFDFGA